MAGIEFEHEDMSAKLIGRILNNNEALTNEVEADDEAKIALQDGEETARKLARWDDTANLEDPPFLSVSDFLLVKSAETKRGLIIITIIIIFINKFYVNFIS